MSSITFYDTVTHVPAEWANDVDALVYDIFSGSSNRSQAIAALGLGSLSLQNANAVSINGGSLNGVTLGLTTPVTAGHATAFKVDNLAVDLNDAVNLETMQNYVLNAITGGIADFDSGLGNMALQNKNNVQIIGGILDSVVIGGNSPADGRFITLKMTSSPSEGDDVVTLGYLTALYGPLFASIKSMAYQAKEAVDIIGGHINGVDIGTVVAGPARFTTARVAAAPVLGSDVVNKDAMDTAISSSLATLGSMAFQNSNAVQIVGGTIDGAIIGSLVPSTGTFSSITVQQNNPFVRIKTLATTPSTADATLYFAEGGVDKGFVTCIGGANTVYPNAFVNAMYMKANFKLVLQGQNVQTSISDAEGIYVNWGANSAVTPTLSSVPTLTLGNILGGVYGNGVIRISSNGTYGVIQGDGGDILIDCSVTNNVRIGSLAGGTLFNTLTNPGSEKVYAGAGLAANQVRTPLLLIGDATLSTTGYLSSGITVKKANGSATQKNIVMRLANNKVGGSTVVQDTLAIDFCSGDASSVTLPLDLAGETMAQGRICVPTANANPALYIEVSNSVNQMMRSIQMNATGNVQINPQLSSNPAEDSFHSLQVYGSSVADGWNTRTFSGSMTGAINLSRVNGETQIINMTGNVSVTLGAPTAPGNSHQRMVLYFNQGASGGKTITFTTPVQWTNSSAPDSSGRAANFVDRIDVWTYNNGSTWQGYWYGFGTNALGGFATQAWVTANFAPLSALSGYLPLAGGTLTGGLTVLSDVVIRRNATPTTGYVYFGNSGGRYFGYDASQFIANGHMYVAGNVYATGNITAFSDARMKYDIRPLTNAMDLIRASRPVRFKRKSDDQEDVGFVAQELQPIARELVHEVMIEGKTRLAVSYGNITAYLAAALTETERALLARIENLEVHVANLMNIEVTELRQ